MTFMIRMTTLCCEKLYFDATCPTEKNPLESEPSALKGTGLCILGPLDCNIFTPQFAHFLCSKFNYKLILFLSTKYIYQGMVAIKNKEKHIILFLKYEKYLKKKLNT